MKSLADSFLRSAGGLFVLALFEGHSQFKLSKALIGSGNHRRIDFTRKNQTPINW
jgi:hypothetical protein